MEDHKKTFERKRKRKKYVKERVQHVRGREKKESSAFIPNKATSANSANDSWEEGCGNVNSMDPDLYTAAMEGNILEFAQAVDEGPADRQFDVPASCIQRSPQKNTALHIATSFGHHEIVNLICKDLPFFISEKNFKGNTAVHIAACSGDSSLVRLLVNAIRDEEMEAVLGEQNNEGNTALHEALRYRHESVARIFIDKNRDMSYPVNEEGESVLYLAADAGYAELVRLIMENPVGNINGEGNSRIRSPVHAATRGRRIDVLNVMWEKDQSSFHSRCEEGRNPLHFAASIGYLEGVKFLLEKFSAAAYQKDRNGQFPIHIASEKGDIEIIQEFLFHCPDSWELMNQRGQNLLHAAAKNGKYDVIKFMLEAPILQKIVNERDCNGNTPLHLATIYHHPKIVTILSQDSRVNLRLKNKKERTAYDIANLNMGTMASLRRRLTFLALKLAYARRSQWNLIKNKRQNPMQEGFSKSESHNDKVTVILLVSTFIATVTFTAGFTIPGGDNNSNPDQGKATLVMEKMFHVFVICDTLAMFSSITAAFVLIWAQLSGHGLVPFALKFAWPMLGVSVAMTPVAFMAGVYLVVTKLAWLGQAVLFMGLVWFAIFLALFLPLCFLDSSNPRILRYISYLPFQLMLSTFGSYSDEED